MTCRTSPGARSLLVQVYNACVQTWGACHESGAGNSFLRPLDNTKFVPAGEALNRRENRVCSFAAGIAGCLLDFRHEDLPIALHGCEEEELKGMLIDSSGSLNLQPVISEQLLAGGHLTQREQTQCFVQFVFLSCLDESVMAFATMCVESMLGLLGKSSHQACKQSSCIVSTDHVWRWLACLTASSLIGASLYRKDFLLRSHSLVKRFRLHPCPLLFLRACFLSCLDFFQALGLHPAKIYCVSEEAFQSLANHLEMPGKDALLILTVAFFCGASRRLGDSYSAMCCKTIWHANLTYSCRRDSHAFLQDVGQQKGLLVLEKQLDNLFIWHIWYFAKKLHTVQFSKVIHIIHIAQVLLLIHQARQIQATSSTVRQSQKTPEPKLPCCPCSPRSVLSPPLPWHTMFHQAAHLPKLGQRRLPPRLELWLGLQHRRDLVHGIDTHSPVGKVKKCLRRPTGCCRPGRSGRPEFADKPRHNGFPKKLPKSTHTHGADNPHILSQLFPGFLQNAPLVVTKAVLSILDRLLLSPSCAPGEVGGGIKLAAESPYNPKNIFINVERKGYLRNNFGKDHPSRPGIGRGTVFRSTYGTGCGKVTHGTPQR